jgi:nodulation protein E
MQRPRIVITGIGGLCSLGVNVPEIWDSMRSGRPGIGAITTAPLHELKVRIGAEIKTLPENDLDHKRTVTMDRFSLLAALAAGEAISNAGLTVDDTNTTRIGAVVGTGI